LGQVVLKLADMKIKKYNEDWFDLDKPDRKSKRRRSSSSSKSRSDRESSNGEYTLAESVRGELKLSYAVVPLQGVDAVPEVEPYEENFNKLYKIIYDRLVIADNASDIRPFAQKLRDSRPRTSSTSSTGSSKSSDKRATIEESGALDDDLADSLSDDSDAEDTKASPVVENARNSMQHNNLRQSNGVQSMRFNLSDVSQSILDDFADVFCVPKHFADLWCA
jgi:hypothetical protein